ncbi:hypothetical protein MRB53_040609 [Persea americana]|nr:hypothetical protein MRB53_040609 [Persea americana]
MRTINCRDDSLATSGGMWNTMKQRKRCIVVCQGFYEWLKKNGGKDKIPHFVKRKDGQLMCFAGLWDCAKFEGIVAAALCYAGMLTAMSDTEEKLYTYTIITTDSNKQLNFLHDRMPVIFDNGSPEMFKWLDSNTSEWTKDLQALLRPYTGELDCYPVPREVGKVGNNSASFIVPIDSTENKQNIANFFGNAKKTAKDPGAKQDAAHVEAEVLNNGPGIETDEEDNRGTTDAEVGTENNAPLPTSAKKRGADHDAGARSPKIQKTSKSVESSPATQSGAGARKTRSSTHNDSTIAKSPAKSAAGSQRITSFFKQST